MSKQLNIVKRLSPTPEPQTMQTVSTIVCLCDAQGLLQHVSEAAAAWLHANPQTLIGQYWFKLVALEDRLLAQQYQQHLKKSTNTFSCALRFHLSMGHNVWFNICFEPVSAKTTQSMQWLIIIEPKFSMSFSLALNNLLEHLEHAPFATVLLNQALEVCYCSENAAHLLDKTVNSLYQNDFIVAVQHLLSKEDKTQLEHALHQALKGSRTGYLGTYKLLRAPYPRYCKCFASMQQTLMDKPALMLFLQDVSEQEQMRHSLQTVHEHLNFHINNTPLAVLEWNAQRQITRWSAVAEQVFGWQADEVLGKVLDGWLFADETNVLDMLNSFELKHETAQKTIHRNYTKSGAVLVCEWYPSYQYDAQGQPISTLAFIQDITAQEYDRQALAVAHENLVFHIDNVPAACLEWDTQLRLVRWSRYAEQLFGWEAKDMLGLHYSECPFLTQQEMDALSSLLDELISGKSTYFFNHSSNRDKNGSIVLCDWYSSARIINNQLVSILSFGYDVTANEKLRRSLLESESRFHQLTENIRDIFFIRDFFNHQHNYISPAYERIFHQPCSAYLADPFNWLKQVYPEDKPLVLNAIEQQRLGLDTDIEYRINDANNEFIWLHEKTFPLVDQDGRVFRVVGLCEEITSHKNAELQQLFVNQQLETANRELARAARLKDEFIANISHELRTPLNVIMSNTELLLDHIYGDLNTEQTLHLDVMYKQGDKLLSIINDIIYLSQAEAGKLELNFKLVSCQKLCSDSFNFVSNKIAHKKQHYELTLDRKVQDVVVDEYFFKQILICLLDNACKFTSERQAIGLKVELDEVRACVVFTVWDTGIGIASEHVSYLFRPFVQLDSSLFRQYEGCGLGLVLVQYLVELHQGKVSVESEIGVGSRFKIWIPQSHLSPI